MELVEKIHEVEEVLNSHFKEREELIKLLSLSVISRAHLFILGPVGTGKTRLIKSFAQLISCKFFTRLLSADMPPSELLGPYDISKFRQGQLARKHDNYLPSAHIAFIDEIFKSNAVVRNHLLSIMEERVIATGDEVIRCDLISLFGASNELPQDPANNAVFDRFTLRYRVDYVKDDRNFVEMITAENNVQLDPILTLDELQSLHRRLSSVQVGSHVVDFIVDLRKKLAEEGIVASDRRWKQLVQLLKANALRNGSDSVDESHFDVAPHVLWSTPDQYPTVVALTEKIVDPFGYEVLKIKEEAESIYENATKQIQSTHDLQAMFAIMGEGITKLKGLITTLEDMRGKAKGKSGEKVENTLKTINRLMEDILNAGRKKGGTP